MINTYPYTLVALLLTIVVVAALMHHHMEALLARSRERTEYLEQTNAIMTRRLNELYAMKEMLEGELREEIGSHDLTRQCLRYQTKNLERITGKRPLASSLLGMCQERA